MIVNSRFLPALFTVWIITGCTYCQAAPGTYSTTTPAFKFDRS